MSKGGEIVERTKENVLDAVLREVVKGFTVDVTGKTKDQIIYVSSANWKD